MAQPAEVIQFPGRPAGDQTPGADSPGRSPQVEDGFTRIANELLVALIQAPLTDRERRVALAVVRLTYGWNKKADRLADSQIAEVAHLPRQRVNQVKQQLVAKKVLLVVGAGHGMMSLNKRFDEWDLDAKHTPKKRPDQEGDKGGDSVTHGSDKVCHPRGCTPKTKDIGEPLRGSSGSSDDEPRSDSSKSATPKLPDCPHMQIIDQWAEHMPDKRQPLRSAWASSPRAKDLAHRWKQGFSITNDKTGEPLYHDVPTGIAWWGKFFRFLRRSEFLMRDDHKWFGLDWVTKRSNFEKILEMAYHGDMA